MAHQILPHPKPTKDGTMKTVALYARVSTVNGQDPETQRLALREYAQARGLKSHREYVDVGVSGSKDRRPALNELMKDSHRRHFDGVLVARFDRFARSTRHLVMALDEFNALGVHFISLNESIDTSTPMGKMVFTVIAAVAELERSIIQERIKAGLARAKKQGKRLGRVPVSVSPLKVRQLREKGLTLVEIAKRTKVSKSTVHRLLKETEEKGQ